MKKLHHQYIQKFKKMKTFFLSTLISLNLSGVNPLTKAQPNFPSEGLLKASVSNEKTLKSTPEKVTIYLQGAQVFRLANINLIKGDNYVVFEGLENNIDPSSIQAGGSGNCIITEVQHVVKYPEAEKIKISGDAKFQKALKNMNDSITILDYILEEQQNRKLVLETEKSVLLNYSLYKGTSRKDSILLLKDGLSFLRDKLNNIYSELMKIKKEQAKTQELKSNLQARIQVLQIDLNNQTTTSNINEVNKPDYRIALTINSDFATNVQLKLNYYVSNAGWTPFYDLRTNGADKGISLTYKGNVKQMTGVDWNNVKITLSTGNPKQNFNIPELNQWTIGDYISMNQDRMNKNKNLSSSNTTMFASPSISSKGNETYAWSTDDVKDEEDISFTYEYTSKDLNMIQAEFEISLPYNIPSDNKNHMVSVSQKELETQYVYKTVPKIDPTAFLTARISGWEDMNLLPGNATVYFDGTYIGQTYLNTGVVSDTLELSLGQDKNVVVKRSKSKDKSKEKFLDNDKMYTFAYEIFIRNGNNKAIAIEIIDQLPTTKNNKIKIEAEDLDGANLDENTGKLLWRKTVKAKDNKKITFTYQIKSPKEIPLTFK